jgi:catechol 2,3-dioxygenase-like lactoylglutathione lyase family enzyme
MNLNHLDIPVSDIAQTRTFFERYFGFKVSVRWTPS